MECLKHYVPRPRLEQISLAFAWLFLLVEWCVLPCRAAELGSIWNQVTFGQPLESRSVVLVDGAQLWAIGFDSKVRQSIDGEAWSLVGEVPPQAAESQGFVKIDGTYMTMHSAGFWATSTPLATWTKVGDDSPMGRMGGAEYLLFNDHIVSVGGFEGDVKEIWTCTDGTDWQRLLASAPYSRRTSFGSAAFGGRIWFFPGAPPLDNLTADDIWSSANGVEWRQDMVKAPWAPRWSYATAVFKNRIYIVGGYQRPNQMSDVWSSEDGTNWTQTLSDQPYLALGGESAYVWDNHLYVFGGRSLSTWRTADGEHWELLPNSTPWTERSGFGSAVFKKKIYMLGGEDGLGVHSSVWTTTNGADWQEVSPVAPWAGRRGLGAVVKDGYLWIYGGADRTQSYSDVWRSLDGVQWEEVSGDAGWTPRYFFGSAAFDGYLWAAGGMNSNGTGRSDVWRSADGVNWEQVTTDAAWGPLFSLGMAAHNGKLWIAGGGRISNGSELGVYKVWSSTDGVDWQQTADLVGASNAVLRSYAGKLWISGGLIQDDPEHGITTYRSELQSSEDGVTWTTVNPEASWEGRRAHGMEFLGKRAVLWGGATDTHLHDIWTSDGDFHTQTADRNQDYSLDLSELLRLIQFYNVGVLHCDAAAEDGFAPGAGDTSCSPHNSDYSDQDWTLSLSEVLRAIQFYNTPNGYISCASGEDGFCPAP